MSHEIVLERVYTIPFYPKMNGIPRTKRAPRAMRMIREFVSKHLKSDELIFDAEVNEFIWARGIQKPPRKITVRVVKSDDDVVEIFLVSSKDQEILTPEPIPISTEPSETDLDSEEDFDEDEE